METIAVYWEPVIKTYGIMERTGMSLISMPLGATGPDAHAPGYLEAYLYIAKGWDNVKIVFASSPRGDGMDLHILLDGISDPLPQDLERFPGLRVEAPVELVFLQGPHFGDRYGIAEAALVALADHQVSMRAMVCAGASVYIILPENTTREAATALSQAFAGPTSSSSKPSS